MAKDIIKINSQLMNAIAQSFDSEGLPLPFVQGIFLIECQVAGTSHVDIREIEPELKPEDILVFTREANNPHDKLAIRISDKEGNKLGYVPREKNEILARLMDAGKIVFGKLKTKAWLESWLMLGIQVYMRDI